VGWDRGGGPSRGPRDAPPSHPSPRVAPRCMHRVSMRRPHESTRASPTVQRRAPGVRALRSGRPLPAPPLHAPSLFPVTTRKNKPHPEAIMCNPQLCWHADAPTQQRPRAMRDSDARMGSGSAGGFAPGLRGGAKHALTGQPRLEMLDGSGGVA